MFWGGVQSADTIQVGHSSIEGEAHSFPASGAASLRQLGSVEGPVDPKGSHLGSRKPLPVERGEERRGEEWRGEERRGEERRGIG